MNGFLIKISLTYFHFIKLTKLYTFVFIIYLLLKIHPLKIQQKLLFTNIPHNLIKL